MFDHGKFGGGPAPDATGSARGAVIEGRRGDAGHVTDALVAAIDELLALDPDGIGDGGLAAAMVGLRRQQARLAAAVAGLTAAFDTRRVWADDGSRSPIDWIAVRARVPRPQAAGEVRDARRLRTMPTTRAAYSRGDLSPAHVRTLTKLAGHPRAGEHFPDSEALLVDHARTNRFDDWSRLCHHWRDAADPDGPEQRRARDHDLRRFTLHTGLDGVTHPDGYLTAIASATVGGALERLERELFDTDWAAAKAIHGDDVTTAHLARTPAQRRHDALVLMAERAMATPADARRPAPLVTVLVDYPTLTGRVCELAATGTIVAPGDILELLTRDDTLIQRAVFDSPNTITDISSARTFRGTLRRILDLVHRRCHHDTCHTPAHHCQADHVIPWTQGGPTAIDNGGLACGPHNRWYYTHEQRNGPPSPADDTDNGLGTVHAVARRDRDPTNRPPVAASSEHVDGADHLVRDPGHSPAGVAADGAHAMPVTRARARPRIRHRRVPNGRWAGADLVYVDGGGRLTIDLDPPPADADADDA
jgi:Domain of unknown function (DUF222)